VWWYAGALVPARHAASHALGRMGGRGQQTARPARAAQEAAVHPAAAAAAPPSTTSAGRLAAALLLVRSTFALVWLAGEAHTAAAPK